MRKTVHVACAVIRDDQGKILAARRSSGRALGGLWEFPGGKIEANESAEVALRREIMEELGLLLNGLTPMKPTSHDDGNVTIVLIPFASRWTGSEPTLSDHSEIRWLLPSALRSVQWAPADLPIVAELEAAS